MIYLVWFIISCSLWSVLLVSDAVEIACIMCLSLEDRAKLKKGAGEIYPILHGLLCASTLTSASLVFNW